jgi:hypothetical protein
LRHHRTAQPHVPFHDPRPAAAGEQAHSIQHRPALLTFADYSTSVSYQLLWLDRLALASYNASRAASIGIAAAGINTSGSLFYNGATAALEFMW